MSSAFKGRREDKRLITGAGRYTADCNQPGQLYAAFLRSDRAHAEIVSIDIADVDVGENIGARLSADQAEADMRVAQAKAEQRRADFTAREQEMVALVQKNRAEVVLAEASVPMAIAEAFRNRSLGLMDYYELKNVQADTQMRATIAGTSK